jgi:phosphatidylglycerol:prolipoprotein diacylglycerol transferase
MAALIYGVARFTIEYVREPDAHLQHLVEQTGLSMGQWLTIPMILIGLYLVATAANRRQRIEPVAGTESVA